MSVLIRITFLSEQTPAVSLKLRSNLSIYKHGKRATSEKAVYAVHNADTCQTLYFHTVALCGHTWFTGSNVNQGVMYTPSAGKYAYVYASCAKWRRDTGLFLSYFHPSPCTLDLSIIPSWRINATQLAIQWASFDALFNDLHSFRTFTRHVRNFQKLFLSRAKFLHFSLTTNFRLNCFKIVISWKWF